MVDRDGVEGLLGLSVKVHQHERSIAGNGREIEAVIATLDAEIWLQGADLLQRERRALTGAELGLGVGVGEEDEPEGAGGWQSLRRCLESGAGGEGSGKREEAAAGESHRFIVAPRCERG